MKVLLCGGGNAIHVLSAYVSAKSDTHVTILSLFPGEADRLRDAIPEEGIRCVNDLGDDVLGKPDAVIDKVSWNYIIMIQYYIYASANQPRFHFSYHLGRGRPKGLGYRHLCPSKLYP